MSAIAEHRDLKDNSRGVMDDEAAGELAARLVDEALEGFDHLVSPEVLKVIAAVLETELLATEEGQRMLRSLAPDPVVDHSGTVANVPEDSATPLRKPAGGR